MTLCYTIPTMPPFAKTIGHKTAQDVLLRMFAHKRAPHALLIVGPVHVGKTHIITELVHHLLQTDRSIDALADVSSVSREMDEKTKKQKNQISVKQIRLLCERLSLSSLGGSWKIGIVNEAHHLSIAAANALLKTLEEPKGQTLIILRAPSIESVLPTIASRSQHIRLTIVPSQQITDALQKRGLSKPDALSIAMRSMGRPGLALRYVTDSELRARKETAILQARTIFAAKLPEQFKAVQELIPKTEVDKPRVLARLLDDWSEVLREQMLLEIEAGKKVPHCAWVLRRMQESKIAMRHHVNPHLALEHLFL